MNTVNWKPRYKKYLIALVVLTTLATLAGAISLYMHPDWYGFVVTIVSGIVGISLSIIGYLDIRIAEIYATALLGNEPELVEVTVINYHTDNKGLSQVETFEYYVSAFKLVYKIGGVAVYRSLGGGIAILESFLLFENVRYFEKK